MIYSLVLNSELSEILEHVPYVLYKTVRTKQSRSLYLIMRIVAHDLENDE